MVTGIALGVMVGFLSAAAFALCLLAAHRGQALPAATSILAIPSSCFAGGWLTSLFDVEDILSAYVAALSLTTIVLGALPLFRLIVLVSSGLKPES